MVDATKRGLLLQIVNICVLPTKTISIIKNNNDNQTKITLLLAVSRKVDAACFKFDFQYSKYRVDRTCA